MMKKMAAGAKDQSSEYGKLTMQKKKTVVLLLFRMLGKTFNEKATEGREKALEDDEENGCFFSSGSRAKFGIHYSVADREKF
ncbi:hypothetical protein V6N12_030365 [Hibiscus sabdariffa]|uniref:Uncharacterized protein n=1 Tax=Hibiscus sabdariffa TaxID=183260 RepID=A0ABR2C0Q2_9ROSI